jgi:hypothetical protein
VAIKDIVRRTGRSRKLVRQVVRGSRMDVFGLPPEEWRVEIRAVMLPYRC